MHRFKYLLDKGHRELDVLWCLLSLCLIFREGIMAESLSMVEGYTDMRWTLLCKHFIKCVTKAHDSGCIQSFRVYTRVPKECVIGTIDERVGINKKEFRHN